MAKIKNTSSSSDGASCDTSAKYKGVRKRKWGKWVSEVRLPNSRERIWLGSYDTPEKAARAFDAAQFCLRGRSVNFNFPDNPPEIAGVRSMSPAEIQAAAARFANLPFEVGLQNEPDRTAEDESVAYSPSISDGTMGLMDGKVVEVEESFYEGLSLSSTLGSGNYASDFGLFSGFGEFFTAGDFCSHQERDNFDYGEGVYDASLYENSYLWNF